MNPKERLINTLNGTEVDRPPVICPGGMMNAAVTGVVAKLEANHNLDQEAMVKAAKLVYQLTGFENYGVPFCMTVECEPLGIELDLGDQTVEPRVVEYNSNQIREIMDNYEIDPTQDGRMPTVLGAISELKNDQLPVIGNLTGHISTMTSIIDPLVIFRLLRKEPDLIADFAAYVTDYLIDYAQTMVEAGADLITISDPTATGEILGSKNFAQFALPYYQQLIKSLHHKDIPVIIHICGDVKMIVDELNLIGADAISFDSKVNMRAVSDQLETKVMGNISTQLLQSGKEDKIVSITRNAIESGVDIIAPACGLSMATSLDNLQVMTDFVKGGNCN
ncbi:MAG: uroporphyrinogen decarboxylase family protein [Bacillota bacterium]